MSNSIEQCEAARDIREAFGVDKATGYLIGEKFLNFVQASDGHPEFAAELPRTGSVGASRTGGPCEQPARIVGAPPGC